LFAILTALFASFGSRAALQLEILALRHHLGVLQRSVKRPKLTASDRLLWAWLSSAWRDWRSALIIIKPEAVIGWHRKGFRLYWKWKSRHGRRGRPRVAAETIQLIRRLSRENPLSGAPRIHGELLKLGIDIGETSVSKYLVRGKESVVSSVDAIGEVQIYSFRFLGQTCCGKCKPLSVGNFAGPTDFSLASCVLSAGSSFSLD